MSVTTSAVLLSSLTAEQLAAVTAEGPVVHVSAGPGSGKTTVLAARIAWLIESGVDALEILALTFTRAACSTIRSRVIAQVGPVADQVSVRTFHEEALVHFDATAVASAHEAKAAIDSLYKGGMRRPPRDIPGKKALDAAITQYEASGGGLVRGDEGNAVLLVLARLEDASLGNGTLIPTWRLVPRLLHRGPTRKYRHVLVDEGQDVTPAECRMAATLLEAGASSLYVVSDPRQAIMGWRGAAPLWPKPTHALTRTFRFGEAIAEEANALKVGDPIVGSDDVADQVRTIGLEDLVEAELLDLGVERAYGYTCAILTRTHADADAIERLLPDHARHVQRDPLDSLSSPADRIAQATRGGHVPILTVHAAKGQEWDRVIVIGPSTIKWGLASEDEEEKRVLYVAQTRARRQLVLVGGIPEVDGWRVRADGLAGGGA